MASERPLQMWPSDFTTYQASDGRMFRTFCVLDDHTRECFCMETDVSLLACPVLRVLGRIKWRGKPKAIRFDNSSEFVSRACGN